MLVSHISHGITGQSTLAVMQAADCRSDFLHALVAGFCVGAGVYHQGGLRATMLELHSLTLLPKEELRNHIESRLAEGERIMGFGHRFHTRDPRARTLLEIADEQGFRGRHLETLKAIEAILHPRKGIAANIEGAGGAILLDLGFDPRIAHLVIVVGRSPMFAAVYLERLASGLPPFPKIEVADVLGEAKHG